MRRAGVRAVAALLLAVALGCDDPVAMEQVRRYLEGEIGLVGDTGLDARIAAVESGLRPAGSSGTSHLLDRMADFSLPGLAVAVIHRGVVEWAKGYGEIEAGSGVPVTTFTRFQAASISKPLTAVTALTLVEDGVLELDGDVADVLTSWQIPDNEWTDTSPVTLRRLMSHTAGFNVPSYAGYSLADPIPTLVQILNGQPPARSAAVQLLREPGLFYGYSGGGVLVEQQVLEDATGESLGALARARVLGPAGMQSSSFRQPPDASEAARSARVHLLGSPIPGVPWVVYPELAAAGLWTTPVDLARFLVAVQRARAGEPGAILGADLAREMLSLQIFGIDGPIGLGFFLDSPTDPQWFSHLGGNFGFESEAVASVEGGYGAVVMVNSNGSRVVAGELIDAIAAVYGWPSW